MKRPTFTGTHHALPPRHAARAAPPRGPDRPRGAPQGLRHGHDLGRRGRHGQGRRGVHRARHRPRSAEKTRVTTPALDGPSNLISARPGPDLATHGYTEPEYVVPGAARSSIGERPADGRWLLEWGDSADSRPGVVVRRPRDTAGLQRDTVVEWLKSAAAPTRRRVEDLSDEIVRRGHVQSGLGPVRRRRGQVRHGRRPRPEAAEGRPRYAALSHPGDAYCYGSSTTFVQGLHRPARWPTSATSTTGSRWATAVGVRADDLRQGGSRRASQRRRLPGPLARRLFDAARRAPQSPWTSPTSATTNRR